MDYTLEVVREIWDDTNGCCVEVGPDRDVSDLVEVRFRNNEGKIETRMTFMPAQARLIAQAILTCANEIEVEWG